MCQGCGGGKKSSPPPMKAMPSTPRIMVADDNFKLCIYRHPNRGQHPVIGQALFRDRVEGINMIGNDQGWRIHYGFRGGGETFLVHVADIDLVPHLFEPTQDTFPVAQVPPPAEPIPIEGPAVVIDFNEDGPPTPKRIDMAGIMEKKDFDLQKLSGITQKIAEQMKDRGIKSAQDILDKGEDWLTTLSGVGDTRAKNILAAAQRVLDGA